MLHNYTVVVVNFFLLNVTRRSRLWRPRRVKDETSVSTVISRMATCCALPIQMAKPLSAIIMVGNPLCGAHCEENDDLSFQCLVTN